MEHDRRIRREFSKQAPRFGDNGLTLSSPDILDWIVSTLPLHREFRVLDVAAGTGHLSRAVASHVKEVVAIDITREMLGQARQEIAKGKRNNISIEEGNAENLPHATNCFDLVLSRLAIHHFQNPAIQIEEMVRVCKPDHRIGIIDLLAPEEERFTVIYNDLERLRDPSHATALSKKQMGKLLTEAGIAEETIAIRDVEVDFQRWVEMTETKPETVELLKQVLMKEISDGPKTGMRPFLHAGNLKFLQVWSVMVGTKRT
jgi:ubiquinone/menaquinone biosynthesis C-methylase UbiE